MGAEYIDQSTQGSVMSVDPALEPILEAVHLRKYFPLNTFKIIGPRDTAHAVEDNSLKLYPGRALALVGESGSGKTTMARMLARLYEPTSGTINYRGIPIKDSPLLRLKVYRRGIVNLAIIAELIVLDSGRKWGVNPKCVQKYTL